MLVRDFDGGVLIRFEKGESAMDMFHAFLKERGIGFGYFSAIGAVQSATFGFYRLDIKDYIWNEYNEEMEVASWSGNVAMRDGEPFAHTHAVFGRPDGAAVGGHVQEAVVGATLELVLTVIPGRIERQMDSDIGLALLCP